MIAARHPLSPRQLVFWVIAAAALFFLLWLLRGVLMPFVLGMAVAFVCDPLADRLEAIKVPRPLATLIVLLVVFGMFIVGLVLVVPVLQDQIVQLVERIPHYAELVRQKVLPELTRVLQRVSGTNNEDDISRAATSYAGDVSSWLVGFLGGVWSSGVAVFNVLYVILLTPLVAYYFLRDWDRIIARIDSWLPRRQAGTLREIAHEIDAMLSGFIRGQATVCLVFAIYYGVALTATGLNFGLIIGIAAGALTFIPYLGAIVGFVVSIGVALGQFDDYTRVVIVAGVYLLGHVVEANLVTPTLVGDRVGLHPVWVLFALLAGGALFGFTGVLLALPVAAVIGVLVRFSLRQYLASSFYDDLDDDPLELVPPLPPAETPPL